MVDFSLINKNLFEQKENLEKKIHMAVAKNLTKTHAQY